MKEEKDLLKNYGRSNPYTVPEGYFDQFAENLMKQLPEKEMLEATEIKLWDRIKPWIYMAAMFVGLMLTVRTFVSEQKTQDTDFNIESVAEMPDEYLDPIVNQTMMDDYELYEYLTDATPSIYN